MANAFCNPDCGATGARDYVDPEGFLSPWLQELYNGLDVWVASRYGLAGLYNVHHSGA